LCLASSIPRTSLNVKSTVSCTIPIDNKAPSPTIRAPTVTSRRTLVITVIPDTQTWALANDTFLAKCMSTHLSTLLLLSARKGVQTLLTRPLRGRQLISPNANYAHLAQADQLTLNQQVPGSSPGRRTNCPRPLRADHAYENVVWV
jgi:hypothetical protein